MAIDTDNNSVETGFVPWEMESMAPRENMTSVGCGWRLLLQSLWAGNSYYRIIWVPGACTEIAANVEIDIDEE